jgi:enoyl-CoA hydratase
MINLSYEKLGENIGVLKINRPKFLNALNYETLKELNSIIDEIKCDKSVYVLIITGEGEKAFVAGADIKEMKDMDAIDATEFSKFGNDVFEKIENLDKVVIGAINGFCLGGGMELALSCDIRIGNSKSKFGQPEVGLGITPGFGGTQRLFNVVGVGKAKELIFTGSMINGDEALRIGLLNKLSENPFEEAVNMGNIIAKNGYLALIQSKKAINFSYSKNLNFDYEAQVFGNCFCTEDQKEGMSAFMEKRKAEFKNK